MFNTLRHIDPLGYFHILWDTFEGSWNLDITLWHFHTLLETFRPSLTPSDTLRHSQILDSLKWCQMFRYSRTLMDNLGHSDIHGHAQILMVSSGMVWNGCSRTLLVTVGYSILVPVKKFKIDFQLQLLPRSTLLLRWVYKWSETQTCHQQKVELDPNCKHQVLNFFKSLIVASWKGLASHRYSKTTFTFHLSILNIVKCFLTLSHQVSVTHSRKRRNN